MCNIRPNKTEDLHGRAPDKSLVALLLIDVINDLDFPEADQLLQHALPMARQIAALKKRAKQAGTGSASGLWTVPGNSCA